MVFLIFFLLLNLASNSQLYLKDMEVRPKYKRTLSVLLFDCDARGWGFSYVYSIWNIILRNNLGHFQSYCVFQIEIGMSVPSGPSDCLLEEFPIKSPNVTMGVWQCLDCHCDNMYVTSDNSLFYWGFSRYPFPQLIFPMLLPQTQRAEHPPVPMFPCAACSSSMFLQKDLH